MLHQLSAFGRLDKPASAVLFAGMGGACQGIQQATGASPLIAVNHCAHAIRVHRLNHPDTIHLQEDVRLVVPRQATRGRKLDFIWMSPDCTDFSRAKGGKPRSSGLRSLAGVGIDWARDVRPRVLFLENVPEFEQWGPLGADSKRIKGRDGEHFRAWVASIRALGYAVEWRALSACDYGSPTTRKRLYLIARRDGLPIVWPEPTHGPGREKPWRTAAECIDWSIPACSIFATRDEARKWAQQVGADGVPKRPLAAATMRRVAHGLVRFVLESPKPYLVNLTHGGRLERLDEPMKTVTGAHRGEKAIIILHLTHLYGTSIGSSVDSPCPTVTGGAGKGNSHIGLVSACLVQTGYGERSGQTPRVLDIEQPLGTVVGAGQKHALVSAWLGKHYTGVVGEDLRQPIGTITAREHFTVCQAHLEAGVQDRSRQVSAFLATYYGQSIGQDLRDPMATVTGHDRFGLVQVMGCPITDVTMRMLQPRELARAMGFPESYRLEGTKGEQVERIGNAVCPQVAEALVRANIGGYGGNL